MNSNWLDPIEWSHIQRAVPIACVDIIPFQLQTRCNKTTHLIGLILRETPHQGRRWCLVGGRLLRNESLTDAVSRQLREALGQEVQFAIEKGIQPNYIAEYFSVPNEIGGFDPRQHSIGLTYFVPVRGNIIAQGEAISFEWFHPSGLPAPHEFGFNQDRVVAACLAYLNPI